MPSGVRIVAICGTFSITNVAGFSSTTSRANSNTSRLRGSSAPALEFAVENPWHGGPPITASRRSMPATLRMRSPVTCLTSPKMNERTGVCSRGRCSPHTANPRLVTVSPSFSRAFSCFFCARRSVFSNRVRSSGVTKWIGIGHCPRFDRYVTDAHTLFSTAQTTSKPASMNPSEKAPHPQKRSTAVGFAWIRSVPGTQMPPGDMPYGSFGSFPTPSSPDAGSWYSRLALFGSMRAHLFCRPPRRVRRPCRFRCCASSVEGPRSAALPGDRAGVFAVSFRYGRVAVATSGRASSGSAPVRC